MAIRLNLENYGRLLEVEPELECLSDGESISWIPLSEDDKGEKPEAGIFEYQSREGILRLELQASDGGWRLRCGFLRCSIGHELILKRLRFRFHLRKGFSDPQVCLRRCLPYDVWGVSRVLPFLDPTPEGMGEYWRAAVYEPSREDEAMGIAVKLPAAWIHQFDFDGGFSLLVHAGVPLTTGETFECDPISITLRGEVEDALGGPQDFSVARQPVTAAPSHTGWNSWDYYRLTVTQEHVLENMEEIRRHAWLRDLVRYIVIDDGWEDWVGHWEPNAKFGYGMSWLCGKIREAGFMPGLWAAPFFAEAGSPVYDEHPEYFVQYDGEPYRPFALVGCGPPWGDRAYLDPTHPEVVDFIFQQWRKFRGWGFRYFKTDFLVNPFKLPRKSTDPGAPPDEPGPDLSGRLRFANASLGLHRCHRQCMTALRAAMGEDSFWLGCGSIWATGAGLMDASRVSADISVRWDDLVKCGRNAFLNQFGHGKIWLNDPDFLVVRGPDTAVPELVDQLKVDDPLSSRPAIPESFTLDEARMWATIVLLSGGVVTLSDPIGLLNEPGLDVLKQVMTRLSGVPGRVVSWTTDLPHVVVQDAGCRTLIGIFNWSNRPIDGLAEEVVPAVALGKTAWRDVWSDRQLSASREWAELSLPSHSCALLESTQV